MNCIKCQGGKEVVGMGCMVQKCDRCKGTGVENEERESQTDGKQDKVKGATESKTEVTVDKSPTKSRKRIRSNQRKECEVGSSAKDIQEREEIRESNEKIGYLNKEYPSIEEIGKAHFGAIIERDIKEVLGLSSPIKSAEPFKVVKQN